MDGVTNPATAADSRERDRIMSYIPGKPIWFEINSTDPEATKRFYTEVLGWKITEAPMGDGTYTMFHGADQQPQCGIGDPQGDRAFWITYVSVEDVDAAAKACAENGGKAIAPPFTVPTVGRMAGLADAEGAVLFAIKGETPDAPDTDSAPGRFYWIELMADDPAAATGYYQKVFGYDEVVTMKMGDGSDYWVFNRDGKSRGGAMGKPMPEIPSHWLPYVHVDDVDATLARVKANGGTVTFPPFDAPGVGRIGHLIDPQGAALGIITPPAG